MMLMIQRANGYFQPVELVPGREVRLGRGSRCHVLLYSRSVSRVHCRVIQRGTRAWIEDLGSTEGTYVNGCPVHASPLKPGDIIGLGSLRIRVSDVMADAATEFLREAYGERQNRAS